MVDQAYLSALFGLDGKVAVLTGGGGALGSAMSHALARAGAGVVALDINLAAAKKVANEIDAAGYQAMAVQADVLRRDSLEQALEQILAHYGRVDILINGAGGNKPEATTSSELSFFDLPKEAFERVFGLNLVGTVLPCQVFGRQMAEQGEGAILNISSISSFRSLTNVAAYSAAKAAVNNFTGWLAVHMARNYSPHIRVNALAPGFFITEQNRYLLTNAETGDLTPRALTILDQTPLKRFGTPEELAGIAIWLASPSAAFAHGAVYTVDGGFAAFSGV